MKINAIDVHPVSVPIRPDRMVSGAAGNHSESPFAIVSIRTDNGLTGIGEVSATPRWSGEDSTTAAHVIARYIAPLLINQPIRSPIEMSSQIQSAISGHLFTKAGVEMAIWDLHGKSLDMPIHMLLGGPVRPEVRTKFSIAGREPDEAAVIAQWASDQGFDAVKVKVGVGADVERYQAVRAALGSKALIGVDANGGWTRAQAYTTGEKLLELGASFLEQPLAKSDLSGLARLRRDLGALVVLDESVGTPSDAAAVIRAEAADVISIYIGMAGGIGPARQMAAMAAGAGIGWTIGSNLEMSVGTAAQLQLAFSQIGLADDAVPCDILSPFYYEYEIGYGIEVAAGRAYPPSGPGLGVNVRQPADAL